MASLKEITNTLPRTIRLRFDSIGGYVQTILSEEQESLPRIMHLSFEEIETVKLVAFTYSVQRLFREGTAAARHAVEELKRFDIPGFQVGNTLFSGQNESVMLGESLAEDLMQCFAGTKYSQLIKSSDKLTELVKNSIIEVRNERAMG